MQIALLILNVLGSVALFLYGMKVMSEGVQRFAGGQLQSYLNRMTHNPYSGAFAGTIFTAALQSSSLVSVLTLSFVNAGLLNLRRAFSVIVGANIGTTLKLLLIVGLGLAWHVETLAFPLIILAIIFYFFRNPKWKDAAHFLIGLAMIFLGFYFLNEFLPDFSTLTYFHQLLDKYMTDESVMSSLIFVLIGIVITFLFHSSSAFTLFAAVLVAKGIPLEQAAMMMIGANIGTTSTALIASTVANQKAKIVAWFHFFYNVAGGILFFFFVPGIIYLLTKYVSTDGEIILISFHTLFNVISAILILPFLNGISDKISTKFLKKEETKTSLKLIGRPFGPTAQMYIHEVKNELLKQVSITRQMVNHLGRMISESDEEKFDELRKRVQELVREGDDLGASVSDYFNSMYAYEMSGQVALNIHRLMDISNHLRSAGENALKIASVHKKRRKNNSFITPKLRIHLMELHDAISIATTTLIQNLNENRKNVNIKEAKSNEKSVDKNFHNSEDALEKAIDKEKLSVLSAIYYKELIQNYEQFGDHLYMANKALGR